MNFKLSHSASSAFSLENVVKNGTPFGHKSINLSKKKYWHPFLSQYLLGIRTQGAIFHPFGMKKSVVQAFYILALIFKNNGHVLFINTNQEYADFIRNLSLLTLKNTQKFSSFPWLQTPKISYSCYKWIGGTLTNYKQISKSILTFAKFSERCENFLLGNAIDFPRYKKIKTWFQGFLVKTRAGPLTLAFQKKPDVIFLVNPNENPHIIEEAAKLHIPIIAFVESTTNLQGITYPIPGNIYAFEFLYQCFKKMIVFSLVYKHS